MRRPFRGLEDEEVQVDGRDESAKLEELQEDLQRRQYHPREATRISHIINQLARKRGYFQNLTEDRWTEAWETVLRQQRQGERLVTATRVGRLRRGVLEVFVQNSTVLQELTFEKSRLLKQLKTQVPEAKLRELKFRVGAVT